MIINNTIQNDLNLLFIKNLSNIKRINFIILNFNNLILKKYLKYLRLNINMYILF